MTQYKPGDILLDKYRIEKLIDEGAFAEVYLVTHMELNVLRALKILRKEAPGVGSTEFEDFQERFRLEVQLGARINHPNVVHVYDFEREGDTLVLVMEYCPGGNLSERIQTARELNRPIPVEEVVNIGLDVSAGLSVIHDMDIVHRDLKPSNILFGTKGKSKIADLGLVQIKGGPSMRSKLSLAAPHPGTPSYMSPEQASQSGYLKPTSNVYALGLILFETLTGRNYNNLKPGTHAKRYRPDVPGWLDRLLCKMLSKSEEERPWDGSEALKTLRKNLQPDKSKIFMTVGGILIVLFITFGFLLFNGSNYYTFIKPATQAITLPTSIVDSSPGEQNIATLSNSIVEFITTEQSTLFPTELPTTTPTVISTPEASPTKESSSTATQKLTDTPTQDPNRPPVNAQAGDNWVSPVDGMTLVYVPEGEFLMGSTDDDPDADDNEKPQHLVYLDAFLIDQTEVTNEMFAAFLNEKGNSTEGGGKWFDSDSEYARILQRGGKWQPVSGYSDHPVVEVNWYGARAYCGWAGRRLPSEAEWEKAARGFDGRTYPWGEDIECSLANYSGWCVYGTTPVGAYPDGASPYGALDMAGNVSECVADWYDFNYYQISPSENPPGPPDGIYKVFRGGSGDANSTGARSSNRNGGSIFYSSYYSGFRCAISP